MPMEPNIPPPSPANWLADGRWSWGSDDSVVAKPSPDIFDDSGRTFS